MNLLQLTARIPDKDSAIQFLQEKRILHNPRICVNGHEMKLYTAGKDRWLCSKKDCRESKQVRQGTFLNNSRLDFRTVVNFIYCWSKEYTTVKFCKDELEVNHNTCVDWNSYMREVCEDHLLRNPKVIGGPNLHVEVDETCFTRRKYNRGRILPNQWVFGGICRETRDCFLVSVPNRSAETLVPIINKYVAPGTTVFSDEWRGYHNLRQNYEHLTVNHSLHFVNPVTQAHTQNVESMWAKAKIRNKRQWGTSRLMLDSYLAEFMWRQRYQDADKFEKILDNIAEFMPPN